VSTIRLRRWTLAGAPITALILLTLGGCAADCGGNAREQYLCELERKVDRVVELMNDPLRKERVEAVILVGGRAGETEAEVYVATFIGPAAKELVDHVELVPLTVAEEIAASEGQEWQADFRDFLATQRPRLQEAAAHLATVVPPQPPRRADPTNFYADVDLEAWDRLKALIDFGVEGDRVYVDHIGQRYYLGDLLSFDERAWFDALAAALPPP
jgi:hypothetical protein